MLQLILIEGICLYYILSRRQNLLKNINSNNSETIKPLILLTLFCVFYNSGWDYFHYDIIYGQIMYSGHYNEDFCFWLMPYIDNYLIWRLIIWGSACFFIVLTARLLSAESKIFYPLFLMLPLISVFYVTRNSLGHAMLFFAISFLYAKGVSIKNIAISASIIIASYFTHKSMPLYYVVAVAAFILPIKRSVILVSIILFPLLYSGITHYSELFLGLDGLSDSMVNSGNSYLAAENVSSLTFIGKMTRFIEAFPVFLILAFSIWNSVTGKYKLTKVSKFFLAYSYILIYASLLFWRQSSAFLHTRFWNASLIPLSLFLGVYLIDKRNSIAVKVFMYSLFISFLYTIVYRIYGWTTYSNLLY